MALVFFSVPYSDGKDCFRGLLRTKKSLRLQALFCKHFVTLLKTGNEHGRINESRKEVIAMSIRKKLENFWYYYKWYVLAAIFFIGAFSYIMYDAAQKPEPDLSICYIGNRASLLGAEQVLEEQLDDWITDVNGDGEKHIEWLEMTFDDDPQKKATIEAQVPAIIAAAECKLFVVNEAYAENLKNLGVFQEEPVPVKGTAAFEEAGVDTEGIYAGVRLAPPTMNEFHRLTLENAQAVYEMIKTEKKG